MSQNFYFLVFSFNRGRFLDNCVRSIAEHVPGACIRIYDDDSDDPATCDVLERLEAQHEVVRARDLGGNSGRHGGLYANMQAAVDAVPDSALFCCIQDDMQIVRTIQPDELAQWREHLVQRPDVAFLHPCFLKGSNRQRDAARTHFDPTTGYYVRKAEVRGAGVYYADVMVSLGGRLEQKGWRFQTRESGNEAQARALFPPMEFLFAPFAMWLPSVPVYRGRQRTRALQWAEHLSACGFHPFNALSEEDAVRLKAREPACLPEAEAWLSLRQPGLPEPWRYDPFQGRNWLRHLDRLERFWRARLGG